MYSTSTSRMDSSARGLTPISSRACRATARMVSELTSTPDSLAISMDNTAPDGWGLSSSPRTAALSGTIRDGAHRLLCLLRFVPAGVSVDDLTHQPVTHDIGAA